MARRKRLLVPNEPFSPGLETNTPQSMPRARMPIAEVAGDTALRAAEGEMAAAMEAAHADGRIAERLALAEIEIHHLARDRMVLDDDDMAALKASLAARGQQTPIEVLRSGATYGLISGLRRVIALRDLGETHVMAFVRQPESAEAAYRAMIEENEIRADLSFYERANIAVMAVGQNVYPDARTAVAGLFKHVPAARRSKILRFVVLRERLGRALTFPTAIPEKLGLALAAAIEDDPQVGRRITAALRKTPPFDADAERRVLEQALKGQGGDAAKPKTRMLAPGLKLTVAKNRAVLSGQVVDEDFAAALADWAVSHAKS